MSFDKLMSKVVVPGYMDCSLTEYATKIIVIIEKEQKKINPDNGLLMVLYDALRCGWELNKKTEQPLKELKEKLDSNESSPGASSQGEPKS